MTTQPSVRLTAQEYLRIERSAEGKSEFLNGEMVGRGGASLRHMVIAANLVRELGSQLRDTPCVVASADLRVATERHRHYTYPDVVVVCDPPQFVDGHFDTLTNPAFIAEVLSDSAEKYDRGAKSEHYRAMPALSEYLLVSQDSVHVELYRGPTTVGCCTSGSTPVRPSIWRRSTAASKPPRSTRRWCSRPDPGVTGR